MFRDNENDGSSLQRFQPLRMDDVVMTRETNFYKIKLIFAIGMQGACLLACVTVQNGYNGDPWRAGEILRQLRDEDKNFKRDFSNFC